MTPGLKDFCEQSREALRGGSLDCALPKIAERLSELLKNPDFVASAFPNGGAGERSELYHDPKLDFYVLAHVQKPGKKGKPHSHGESWAVYGNALGVTRMTDWRRLNDDPEHVELASERIYDLGPGETHFYGPHEIHSTEHPSPAWVIRVTGTDLGAISRYHFRSGADRILEKA